MKFSHFFIRRPIFAAVLSIFIVLLGAIALLTLPIAQYPEITPPTIFVFASYPGASAETMANTVATPVEEQINGVEDMMYMSAQCASDGSMRLAVTFKVGTNPNMAQVLVQNRVDLALPRLPDEVRQLGVTVRKRSPSIAMIVSLISPGGKYGQVYLSNYAYLHVQDVLRRLPGVGDTIIFGARDYAMRIWLDPDKVSARNLTASDVAAAIRRQNIEVAAGQFGQSPQPPDNQFQLAVRIKGRLSSVEEFEDIVLKADTAGQVTRLRDVARVELDANDYNIDGLLDSKPAAGVAIFQQPGSNAIETANAIERTMKELKKAFPEGLDYRIAVDTSAFIRESIHAVLHTLVMAILLVVFVVVLFLQNWRASLIPLVAVPVSLIGTLAAMAAFGFSINNLSLFGLVLAIGIVVDDAIVVVENVERHIAEGLSPVAATQKAMEEVSGAVIAIALVLSAVFIPTAFIRGITGRFYQQFALTIAVSTLISAFNSLTLSPALAALLLQPHHAPRDLLGRLIHGSVGWLFRGFNRVFDASRGGYVGALRRLLRHCGLGLALYAGLLALTWFGFAHVPTGFIPAQDKGNLYCYLQLPDGASLQRTRAVSRRVVQLIKDTPGVALVSEFAGLSLVNMGSSVNASSIFIRLAPFHERAKQGLTGPVILRDLRARIARADIQEATVSVFGPPPVDGLGMLGGFKLQVEDRGAAGYQALEAAVGRLTAAANLDPRIASAMSTFRANVPQVFLDVDRAKAESMGVPLSDVWDTLSIYLGSLYVNDFTYLGRPFHVTAQADAPFRRHPENVLNLKARNVKGEMVPLGTLVRVRDIAAPVLAGHYNMFPTAEITGSAAPGTSSGEMLRTMEDLAQKVLPPGMTIEWTELSYLQILAGNTAIYIFPLCVLMMFLVLAAQYESWSLPLAIILIVPLCLLFAIGGVWARGLENNLFTQIGLVVLMGLACKNAILIVEFARQLQVAGRGRVEAAVEASRLRLRPILMTSLAFTFGVIPLMLSRGAGAEMRTAIGTAVFWGMIGVTLFGIFLTPVFYVVIRRLLGQRHKAPGHEPVAGAAAAGTAASLLVLGGVSVLLLGGCAVGPNYQPPQTAVGASFANGNQPATAANQTAVTWWRGFADPELNRLVALAVTTNLDLRIATARVREARALRSQAILTALPIITGGAGYNKSLSSKDSSPTPLTREQRELQLFDAGFDATWELDLFGGARRAIEAVTAGLAATEQARRDVLVSLIAEVARNYIELRGTQQELAVGRKNVENQRQTLELTEARLRAGRATELDTARARAQWESAQAGLPPLEAASKHALHRLSVLVAQEPAALAGELTAPAPLPALPALISIGTPAELLRRRPDLRAAERSLAAATAAIGVETAQLFPRVTFNGRLAFEASELSGLGEPGSDAYSFGPRLTWAALDLGRVRARLQAAHARAEAQLATYERTVLTALEETENALVDFGRQQAQRDHLAASARSAAAAVALANDRYRSGLVDFLAVLDAERTQLAVEDQLAQSQTRTVTALVAVYKALGGGWEIEAPGAAAAK